MRLADIDPATNAVSGSILDAAIEVHRQLGPGLLESLYEEALTWELQRRGHLVRRQVPIPLEYKDHLLEGGFRLDMIVDDRVIVEIKAVDEIAPVAFAQLDSYVFLARLELGLLINFHVPLLKDGFFRRRARNFTLRESSGTPASAVQISKEQQT